jgi:colanic acid biosynthesis glycosyl transferase WcaI
MMSADLEPRSVLLITSSFFPETLGIGRYSTDIAFVLGGMFQNLTVLCETPDEHFVVKSNLAPNFEKTGLGFNSINILRTRKPRSPKISLIGRLLREMSFLFTGLRYFRKISSAPPTLAVSVIPKVSSLLIGIIFKNYFKIPLLVIVQDVSSSALTEVGLSKSKMLAFFAKRVEGFSLKCADKIICISEQMSVFLVEEFAVTESKISIIPNYFIPMNGEKSDPTLRKRDKFIILYSGALGLKQDLQIISSTADSLIEYPEIEFHIYCAGPGFADMDRIQETRPNIFLSPILPEKEYVRALNEASVFLLAEKSTLRNMCLPSKLTTYFAFEKPVIAVVNPESATAFFLEDSSLIVSPESPEKLLSAILSLKNDTSLYYNCVAKSKYLFEKKMYRENAIENYISVIIELTTHTA